MIGSQLGRYQILKFLGEGGMGQVYVALDTQLGRKVAVKILPQIQLDRDPDALSRFKRETRVVASLSHPNILDIHDVGTEGEISYAVMELLDGETLRQRIRSGPVPWSEAEEIGLQIARGMAAAHAKGIIHRDLKPENVFLTREGQVKILDFGLARITPRANSLSENASTISMLTQPGMLVGTVSYMSPEQVRGDVVDTRSDVFSFGSILCEMVSGRKAFERGTNQDTLAAILRDAPAAIPKELGLPPGLTALIERCLEKDPAQRFASGAELAEVLSGASAISGARTVSGSRIRWPRRHRVLPWSAAALVAAGAVGSVVLFCGRSESIGSLAVLPLVNATGVDSLDYLSDGIAENLVDRMSRASSLKVIAWGTVVQYKGKEVEPEALGEKLHVEALLMGRLSFEGDHLRLGVELVNTKDGRRLWGEQYQRASLNMLGLEEEITRKLSSALRLKGELSETAHLSKQNTESPEAYAYFLKGRYWYSKYTEEGLRKGIELMKKAVEIDPGYALAYAGLASSYTTASTVLINPREAMPKAREAAEQALKLDPSLGEAYVSLGYVQYAYEWNWSEAEAGFRRAIELDPSLASAHVSYGWMLAYQGRFQAAIEEMTQARQLDPLTPLNSGFLAFIYYLARRTDEALALTNELIETDPDFVVGHYNLGQIYLAKGMPKEALAAFQKAKSLDPENPALDALIGRTRALMGHDEEARRIIADLKGKNYVDPFYLVFIYEGLGDKTEAFAELQKACDLRTEGVLGLAVDPFFDGLRGDPRYEEFVRRIGLPLSLKTGS